MSVTYRPLPVWPYPETPADQRRSRWTFKASYPLTLALLEDEIWRLDGSNVVIGAGFREGDVRKDGYPRADARPPSHPGVEVSFDSRHGRLTYSTDVCESWQHNVRSIALGLQALRAVDRYGVSKRGQQYAGWQQLAAGETAEERGRRLVDEAGSMTAALKAHHPDRGGKEADMVAVNAYRASLGNGS